MNDYVNGIIKIELTGRDTDQLKKARMNLIKRFGDKALKLIPEIDGGFLTDTWGNHFCYIIISEDETAEENKNLEWEECTCNWTMDNKRDFYCPIHKT